MSSAISTHGLRLDNRGVTPIIGFILLFGIGVIAFAGYQATTVPDQNAETEFMHSQDIRDEMVDIRGGLLQAGEGDRQFRSITLGTRYQQRLLAINPPPTTGSLETSNPAVIDLEDEGQIETRFLSYQPRYSEIPDDGVVYDTSALYLAPELSDGTVLFEEQAMIDDDEVRLTALQNSYQREGVERASVDLRPGASAPLNVSSQVDGDFTITVPTRLSESDWEGMLGEDWSFEEIENGPNELTLEFDESRSLYLNTVGIGTPPAGTPDGIFSSVIDSATVSDLDANEAGQNQQFNFTIGEDGLADSETVEILIEDPFEEIDYQGATPTVIAGNGTAGYTVDEDEERATITYTATGGGYSEGEEISIELSNVDGTDAEPGETYNIQFVDPVGGVTQASFSIIDPDNPPEGSLSELDIAGQGDDATVFDTANEDISVELTNDGGPGGNFDVELTISNGDQVTRVEQDIKLDEGDSTLVTFEEVTGELSEGDYTVELSTDDDSIAGSLSVDLNPIAVVGIDDLQEGEDGQEQVFEFDLREEMDQGEEVEIDVSDPNEAGVNYEGAEIEAVGMNGASIEEGGDLLVFEVAPDLPPGQVDPITGEHSVTVSGLDVDDDSTGAFEDIQFTREDTDPDASDIGSFEIVG